MGIINFPVTKKWSRSEGLEVDFRQRTFLTPLSALGLWVLVAKMAFSAVINTSVLRRDGGFSS